MQKHPRREVRIRSPGCPCPHLDEWSLFAALVLAADDHERALLDPATEQPLDLRLVGGLPEIEPQRPGNRVPDPIARLNVFPPAPTLNGILHREQVAIRDAGERVRFSNSSRRLTPSFRIGRSFRRSSAALIAALHSASEKKV